MLWHICSVQQVNRRPKDTSLRYLCSYGVLQFTTKFLNKFSESFLTISRNENYSTFLVVLSKFRKFSECFPNFILSSQNSSTIFTKFAQKFPKNFLVKKLLHMFFHYCTKIIWTCLHNFSKIF